MAKKTTAISKARRAYEDALEAGIHIDIGSHNKNPKRRIRNPTAKRSTKSVNDGEKTERLYSEITKAIKSYQTPVKMANRTENMLTRQARLSFAQGMIQAAEISGFVNRAEAKFLLTQLEPDGVIGK